MEARFSGRVKAAMSGMPRIASRPRWWELRDAAYDLIKDAYGARKREEFARKRYSAGVISFYWSLDTTLPLLQHHNIFLSGSIPHPTPGACGRTLLFHLLLYLGNLIRFCNDLSRYTRADGSKLSAQLCGCGSVVVTSAKSGYRRFQTRRELEGLPGGWRREGEAR